MHHDLEPPERVVGGRAALGERAAEGLAAERLEARPEGLLRVCGSGRRAVDRAATGGREGE